MTKPLIAVCDLIRAQELAHRKFTARTKARNQSISKRERAA